MTPASRSIRQRELRELVAAVMRAAKLVLLGQTAEAGQHELSFWEDPTEDGLYSQERCWPVLAVELPFAVAFDSPAGRALLAATRLKAKTAFAVSSATRGRWHRQGVKRPYKQHAGKYGQWLDHVRRAAFALDLTSTATTEGFVNELHCMGVPLR